MFGAYRDFRAKIVTPMPDDPNSKRAKDKR